MGKSRALARLRGPVSSSAFPAGLNCNFRLFGNKAGVVRVPFLSFQTPPCPGGEARSARVPFEQRRSSVALTNEL